MTVTPKTYGPKLKAARQRAGFSRAQAARELVLILPRCEWTTEQTITRLENGGEHKLNPVLIAALCDLYGTKVADVAPEIHDDCLTVANIFARTVAPLAQAS